MPVDDNLAKKDPAELTAEEAQLLAEQRSLVSLEEYDPRQVAADEIVVQGGVGREARAAKDWVADENADPGVKAEAQGAVDSARLARGEPGTSASTQGIAAPANSEPNKAAPPADQPKK